MRHQRMTDKPMTTRSVLHTLNTLSSCNQWRTTCVTPHDLRRSYARNLFLAGIPIEVIRQNLGHVDVKTTQDYIGI
ncbi:MAG: site-specific integrase [Phototrophicaceae bacterium]